jgi:hypothetical protein
VIRNIVLAAMGAAIMGAAVPALASTTMTFSIDITASTGTAAPFTTPILETFTLQDGVLSGGGGPSTDLMGDISGADALTAGLKSQIDLTGSTDYSNWDLGTSEFTPPFPGPPPIVNTEGDIYENIVGAGGAYQQSIDGGALSGYLPPSQNAAGLADFFQQGQTLNWYEAVFNGSFQEIAGYTGTATLVSFSSGAPEPAAWTLMMLGLGGVGVVLRRRGVRAPAT